MTVPYSVTRLLEEGGDGSHVQKVYLYPAFEPSAGPSLLAPGNSVNQQRILASGSFAGSCVGWGFWFVQVGGEAPKRNPGACVTSLPPGLAWWTPALLYSTSFSLFPPCGREEGQDGAVVKNTGCAARWLRIQILATSFSSCVTLNSLISLSELYRSDANNSTYPRGFVGIP